MRERGKAALQLLLVLLPLALAMAAIVGMVVLGERESATVQPVSWNKEPCARCRMLIGDKAFAAQLQLQSGVVQNFDDPGCALTALASLKANELHAAYFRDSARDGWLSSKDVRFVKVNGTPMGYGLGAVDASTPGAMSLEQAMTFLKEVPHGAPR